MTFYLYIKALHIIAVISWMAGMLYLPRLFVYHSNKNNSKEMNETFILMERRLFNYIMRPAMAATWIFGLILVFSSIGSHEMTSTWLITKLFLVLLMENLLYIALKSERKWSCCPAWSSKARESPNPKGKQCASNKEHQVSYITIFLFLTNTALHWKVSKETRLWALVACHECDLPMFEIIAQIISLTFMHTQNL